MALVGRLPAGRAMVGLAPSRGVPGRDRAHAARRKQLASLASWLLAAALIGYQPWLASSPGDSTGAMAADPPPGDVLWQRMAGAPAAWVPSRPQTTPQGGVASS
jgi:hypothetical protein